MAPDAIRGQKSLRGGSIASLSLIRLAATHISLVLIGFCSYIKLGLIGCCSYVKLVLIGCFLEVGFDWLLRREVKFVKDLKRSE